MEVVASNPHGGCDEVYKTEGGPSLSDSATSSIKASELKDSRTLAVTGEGARKLNSVVEATTSVAYDHWRHRW